MLRPLIAFSFFAAATSAAAEPAPLRGEVIKETFTGALIELDTPTDTKIPIRFSDDGLVSGEAGELASYLGSARDRGRWWVAGDRLCVKWFRWFDAEVRCLSLRMDGQRLFWRAHDGKTGTATIAERGKPPAPRQTVAKAEPAREPAPAKEPAGSAPGDEETPSSSSHAMQFAGATAFIPEPRVVPKQVRAPEPVPAHPRSPAPREEPAAPVVEEKPEAHQAAPLPQEQPKRLARRTVPAETKRSASAPKAFAATVSFRVVGVEEDDVLNVRSGPSEYYMPVGGIPPEGRGVRIVGPCQASWCPIRHGSVSGWVNRYYLAEEELRPIGRGALR